MSLNQCLDRIADTMQVPLVYDSKITPPIEGAVKAHYAPLPGLDIPFTVRAEKVFYFDQCGVIFHVLGNLWIMVAHYEKTNSTTAFLIDQGKMSKVVDSGEGIPPTPASLIQSRNNLREAVDTLKAAIVKSFIWKDGAWANLPIK